MNRKLLIVFFSLLVFSMFGSCKKDKTICFDESEPHSLIPDISWALVNEPYVAYRESPDWNSEVIGHCRKNDILEVKGRTISSGEIWYSFDSGYLPGSSVLIYSNRFKALTARGRTN